MIKRERYLNALIDRMNNGMIKVVTGVRRCGKSFLYAVPDILQSFFSD